MGQNDNGRIRKPIRVNNKKPKHFLEQKDALELAASIAQTLEQKSLTKVEKNQDTQAAHHPRDMKPKTGPSASKLKLKETKALLAAKKSQHKREKSKQKREQGSSASGGKSLGMAGLTPVVDKKSAKPRKSVSFA